MLRHQLAPRYLRETRNEYNVEETRSQRWQWAKLWEKNKLYQMEFDIGSDNNIFPTSQIYLILMSCTTWVKQAQTPRQICIKHKHSNKYINTQTNTKKHSNKYKNRQQAKLTFLIAFWNLSLSFQKFFTEISSGFVTIFISEHFYKSGRSEALLLCYMHLRNL